MRAHAPYTRTSDLALVVRVFFFSFSFFFFPFFLFFFFPKSPTRPSRQSRSCHAPLNPVLYIYIPANWWSNYFLKFKICKRLPKGRFVTCSRIFERCCRARVESGVFGPPRSLHTGNTVSSSRFNLDRVRKENFHGHRTNFPRKMSWCPKIHSENRSWPIFPFRLSPPSLS